MTVSTTVVRIVAILLAVGAATGQVAYLDALWWHELQLSSTVARNVSGAVLVLLTAHAVVSTVCSILAVALVLHERHRAAASRALGLTFASWAYLMAYSGITMLFRPVSPGPRRELFEAHFLMVEIVGLAALLRFTALFPRPLGSDELHPLPTLPPSLMPVHRAAVSMRRAYAPWLAGLLVLGATLAWSRMWGVTPGDAGLSRMMDLARFCAAGLVVMNLRRAWTSATEGDRDALGWLLVAFSFLGAALVLLIGGNVLVAVTGFPEPNVAWRPILIDLGLIGFLVAVALSVLHHGRSDAAQLARRIAAAAVVVSGGLFLAAGLEAAFTGAILSTTFRSGVGTAVAFAVTLSAYRGLARLVEGKLPA